ncbi:MAG: acyloxyacyl hydrolase [Chthoniobacterales bacterium]|nr:acyloxyacyl hydrolase [Chthoniobacterales bacterium]
MLTNLPLHCNRAHPPYRSRPFMRIVSLFLALSLCGAASLAHAGNEAVSPRLRLTEREAPRFEVAAETSYLWGSLANPNSYEVQANFITARMRWGAIENDSWLRGFNQVYLLATVQPIVRGPENLYWGISAGFRYNFVQPGSRLVPYVSGGVGLGWIDSQAGVFGAQGQDFTFNILSALGVSYRASDRWQITVGALYEHLSNGGQTIPNPSLNLFGPQVGFTYQF